MREKFLVVVGQILGQASILAVLPVLTRHYTPSELGSYQVGLGVALILVPVATARLEFIIPVTISSVLARRRLRRANFLCVSVCFAIVVLAIGASVTGSSVVVSLWIVPILLFSYGFTAIENSWLIRSELRSRLAARNATAGITAALLQVTVAALSLPAIYLAWSILAGRLLAIMLVRSGTGTLRSQPDATSGDEDDRYEWRQASSVIIAGMLSAATIHGLTLISFIGQDKSTAGYVGVAQRVAGSPLALTGQALSQLSQAATASAIRAGLPLRPVVRRQMASLGAAGIAISFIVGLIGLYFSEPLLGSEWVDVGPIIAVLAIPAAFQVAVSPSDYLLITLKRHWWLLSLQVLRLGSSVSLGVGALLAGHSAFGVAAYYSVGWTFSYVLSLFAIDRAAGIRDRQLKLKEDIFV